MKLWILCCGEAEMNWRERYDASGYEAACRQALESAPAPLSVKPMQANGRPVYVSRHRLCRDTARQLYPEAELRETALLDEALPRREGAAQAPLWLWRRRRGLRGQDRKAAVERCEAMIAELEKSDDDAVLVSHPILITQLLDRLRIHGYCINRGEYGAVKPLERILITRRDMHCGGCSHNCFLSNPGCGIGEDKAARVRMSGKSE